jgi:hypothetical protein
MSTHASRHALNTLTGGRRSCVFSTPPETVRPKNNCRDGRFDGIDEPFGCSVIKQDGFAKLVSSVGMKLETHC